MKTIHIEAEALPMAWEQALVKTWEIGERFPTQYDKPGDENSRDVCALIHIKNPMAEPRIHRCFPAGLDTLETYRSEVLYGIHDYWVNPKEGKWEYTYHQRLFEYEINCDCGGKVNQGDAGSYVGCAKCDGTGRIKINQIDKCIDMLKKCGFTRRAIAVTWKTWEDLGISDPSCLQLMQFRIENNKLNMFVNQRSQDAYKAAFMNFYAFSELQEYVANKVGAGVGEYVHCSSSFHIYGSYFEQFKGFLETIKNRTFEERTWTSSFAKDFFIEGCEQLLLEDNMPQDKKELVIQRKLELSNL